MRLGRISFLCSRASVGFVDKTNGLAKAREAVAKALELDDMLARRSAQIRPGKWICVMAFLRLRLL